MRRGEGGAVEDKPALVEDDQGRRAIEPLPDAVKEIGEHGGGRGGADEPLGLERLHTRVAEAFDLRVEEASPGSADQLWRQRLFELLRLQPDREPGQRAILSGRGSVWVMGGLFVAVWWACGT